MTDMTIEEIERKLGACYKARHHIMVGRNALAEIDAAEALDEMDIIGDLDEAIEWLEDRKGELL